MKEAMIIMERYVEEGGYDAYGLIRYHDEEQWEVSKKLVKFKTFQDEQEAKSFICPEGLLWGAVQEHNGRVFRAYSIIGELGVLSIREAGRILNLNIELDAEYKVGRNWSQTH